MFSISGRFTSIVQEILADKIQRGSVVVDATVGNGNDTVFLAKLVGQEGKVYGFDIQKEALITTKEKLAQLDLLSSVELIHNSHSYIDKYVKEPINGAMFNLGYLPKGDPTIITKPTTTIGALRKILERLTEGGILSILSYYGHSGGKEEKDAIQKYLIQLDHHSFSVIKLDFINKDNNPPIIFMIEKRNKIMKN